MGSPKLLLDVHGETIIHRVTHAAVESGISPVLVVLGANLESIKANLTDLPVIFIENPAWMDGQSTSVTAGIRALPKDTSAVIILLGDQPGVTPMIIKRLVSAYLEEINPPGLLIPEFKGKRGNPVLFNRSTFDAMQSLVGDEGARQIFDRFTIKMIPVEDPDLFKDIDSPQDYQNYIQSTSK